MSTMHSFQNKKKRKVRKESDDTINIIATVYYEDI